MVKRSTSKGTYDENGDKSGKNQLYCTHGIVRKSTATSIRPIQRVNHTGCPCRIYINQHKIGVWKITKAVLNHTGHLLGAEVYSSYSHVKKLNKDDEEYVKGLMEARAAPRNIASCLSHRTGHLYTPRDAQNIIDKIKRHVKDGGILEQHLSEIKSEGGVALWSKNPETNFVETLFIQTADMKKELVTSRPFTFQADTTFRDQ